MHDRHMDAAVSGPVWAQSHGWRGGWGRRSAWAFGRRAVAEGRTGAIGEADAGWARAR